MSSEQKLFGTDGIRGKVGVHPITPEFSHRLGIALGRFFGRDGPSSACIGLDTRKSGSALEKSLVQGLHLSNVSVTTLGVMPTPGIAYTTRHESVDFGVAITASHNPQEYNGFKLFTRTGQKLSVETEQEIERLLDSIEQSELDSLGESDIAKKPSTNSYIQYLNDLAEETGKTNLTGVVDCANGAATTTAPRVFERVLQEVVFIGNEADGTNINRECGSTHPATLSAKVQANQVDIGFAFDGDGDRVVVVDSTGQVLSGDHLLFLLARDLVTNKSYKGGVVGTEVSNFGLESALQSLGVPFERTAVGDRFISQALESHDWLMGGEPSGHIIRRDLMHTGDGVLTALCMVELLSRNDMQLEELLSPLKLIPQVEMSLGVVDPIACTESEEVKVAIAQFNATLAGTGRVVVRASGTESVVRVMVEHRIELEAQKIAKELSNLILVVNSH